MLEIYWGIFMLNITDENFEKEVKQHKGVVVVDFYADWCVDPYSTKILTDNKSLKIAKEITKQDKLITYDGKKLVSDTVVRSLTSDKMGHCKEITTETNRSLRVTDEHEFLTPSGWKKAMELKQGEDVAVIPNYIYNVNSVKNTKIIVTEEDILKHCTKRMRVNRYIQELQNKGLLPLRSDHENLPIISKLMGALFSDGNLYFKESNNYREISFTLGTKEDVGRVVEDLKEVGFEKVHLKVRSNKIDINNRSFTITTHRVKVCSTSLWLLFKALGAPVGDKTNSKYQVPLWVMRGDLLIKENFMSAYMGGDGPKIAVRLVKREGTQPYNKVCINDIEFHKHPDVEKSGLQFANQLVSLFQDLSIEIRKVFVEEDSYTKQDGSKSKIIHIAFKVNFQNAFVLYKNIGYSYSYAKELESSRSAEFIRRILHRKKDWEISYDKAIALNNRQGYGYRRLSEILNINSNTIYNWIKKKTSPTIKRHNIKYPEWLKQNTEGLPAKMFWESIKSIEEIYLKEVQKITMKSNHNFIANEFLAHNCGPCRVMGPVFEEVSEEVKDAKFVKVDVDKAQATAGAFGVMSIPTLIILKDGKEVQRFQGVQNKSGFVEAIKKHL
jgi:thioredoxin 1